MENAEHYANQACDILREIRNEINTPELRDRLAMASMQGLFSASFDEFWVVNPESRAKTAKHAYEWADAMLKARSA